VQLKDHVASLQLYRKKIIAKEAKAAQEDTISTPLKAYLETNIQTVLRPVLKHLRKGDKEQNPPLSSNKPIIIDAIIDKLQQLEKGHNKDEIDMFINIAENLERPVDPKPREKKNKKDTDLNAPTIVKATRKFTEVLASTPNKEETLKMMNTLLWDKKNVFPFPPRDVQ
jgi:hypothetical protein